MDNYKIDIRPHPESVQVSYRGTLLASSRRALQLDESGHAKVLYFPAEDVNMELLQPSNHHSHCPLKGDASYWSLKLADETVSDLVWAYENPFDKMAAIRGLLAFYQHRVTIETCA